MSVDLESIYRNHPLRWVVFFISLGATTAYGITNAFIVSPLKEEMAHRESDNKNSSAVQQCIANRDEWIQHAKALEARVRACDSNAEIIGQISKLRSQKDGIDTAAASYLSYAYTPNGETIKTNEVQAAEYRRQSVQLQDQILGLEAKLIR
jgi:hypothetical protein